MADPIGRQGGKTSQRPCQPLRAPTSHDPALAVGIRSDGLQRGTTQAGAAGQDLDRQIVDRHPNNICRAMSTWDRVDILETSADQGLYQATRCFEMI